MRQVVLVLAAACLGAQTPTDQVEKSERAFAAMAAKDGTRRAFLHYLADPSYVLRPGVAEARKVYEASKEDGSLLAWWPEWVGAASSGDLAFSTGPFEYRASMDSKVIVHGHFLSLWRLQKDGSWRVEVDAGIPHAAPESTAGSEASTESSRRWGSLRQGLPAVQPESRETKRLDLGALLKGLGEEEARLGKEAAQIGWRCVGSHLAPEGVLYRRGSPPIEARKEQAAALEKDGQGATDTLSASGIAKDGAFGYTLGTAALRTAEGQPGGSRSYLRIWQRQSAGWRILFDLQLPLPEEQTH